MLCIHNRLKASDQRQIGAFWGQNQPKGNFVFMKTLWFFKVAFCPVDCSKNSDTT